MNKNIEISGNMNLGTYSQMELSEEVNESLKEKAVSKAQRKFFGMVDAYKKGEMPDASPAIKKAAKGMTKKEVKDFAKTKHKGLPEYVDESKARKLIREALTNLYGGEDVYTMDNWDRDGELRIKEGQLVDPEVYWELLGSVPPVSNGEIFQPGEAYSHDRKTGEPLYQTFKRESGDYYRYIGLRPLRMKNYNAINEISDDTIDNAYMKAFADTNILPYGTPKRVRRDAQVANFKKHRNERLGFDPFDMKLRMQKSGTSGDEVLDRKWARWQQNHNDRVAGKRTYDKNTGKWTTNISEEQLRSIIREAIVNNFESVDENPITPVVDFSRSYGMDGKIMLGHYSDGRWFVYNKANGKSKYFQSKEEAEAYAEQLYKGTSNDEYLRRQQFNKEVSMDESKSRKLVKETVQKHLVDVMARYIKGDADFEEANKAIMDLANSSNGKTKVNERNNRPFYDYAAEYMKKNGKKLPDDVLTNAAKKNDERFHQRKKHVKLDEEVDKQTEDMIRSTVRKMIKSGELPKNYDGQPLEMAEHYNDVFEKAIDKKFNEIPTNDQNTCCSIVDDEFRKLGGKQDLDGVKNHEECIKKGLSKIVKESYAQEGNYTHFAVSKISNKIINGWDYSDHDPDELKTYKYDYFIKDLEGNGFDPSKCTILTVNGCKRRGIDPYNDANWGNGEELFS